MAKTNAELSSRVAQSSGASMTPEGFNSIMAEWFKANGRRMATLAGSKEEAQRILVAFMQSCAKVPQLLDCSVTSIGIALMNCAQLKLYPGPIGHCAITPFYNSKKRVLEAQWMAMYGGLCQLAHNSGHVISINSNVVYEHDEFDYEEGTRAFLRHKPFNGPESERGEILYYWNLINLRFGPQFLVKSPEFIESIRKRSPSGCADDGSPKGIWKTDYIPMALKTVLKQNLKTVPKSVDLAIAMDLDNASDSAGDARANVVDPSAFDFSDTKKLDSTSIPAGVEVPASGVENVVPEMVPAAPPSS